MGDTMLRGELIAKAGNVFLHALLKGKHNGKYRNQSSIIAFALPKSFKPGNAHGFAIVGAHTDSCNFKLRPISKRRKPADSNYMAIGR